MHLGGNSPLGHRTRSTQEPELVVHRRVKWFEVGGQGRRKRARCKEGEREEEGRRR